MYYGGAGFDIGQNTSYSDFSYFLIFVYIRADPGIVP
jgi:hypothetical protein